MGSPIVGGGIPLCRDAVDVFYSPSRQDSRYYLEDLPRAIDNKDGWQENKKYPCYWLDMMMYINVSCK